MLHCRREFCIVFEYFTTGNRGQPSTVCGGFLEIRRSTGRAGGLLAARSSHESHHGSEFIFPNSARRPELRGKLRWYLPLPVRLRLIESNIYANFLLHLHVYFYRFDLLLLFGKISVNLLIIEFRTPSQVFPKFQFLCLPLSLNFYTVSGIFILHVPFFE